MNAASSAPKTAALNTSEVTKVAVDAFVAVDWSTPDLEENELQNLRQKKRENEHVGVVVVVRESEWKKNEGQERAGQEDEG